MVAKTWILPSLSPVGPAVSQASNFLKNAPKSAGDQQQQKFQGVLYRIEAK
jgi:hypothetical protein